MSLRWNKLSPLSCSGIIDGTSRGTGAPRSAATTVWSQADTDISTVEDGLLKPGEGFPSLKVCMQERDFNIKLAIEKKAVRFIIYIEASSLWQILIIPTWRLLNIKRDWEKGGKAREIIFLVLQIIWL